VRKLILKMSISIDGFVGGPKGEVGWVFDSTSEDAAAWTVGVIEKAGAHLMGSRTFHDMAAYWPRSSDVFARAMNTIPKVVFTRREFAGPDPSATTEALRDATAQGSLEPSAEAQAEAGWAHPTVISGDLAEAIGRLKAVPGGDLVVHGGASFAASVVAAGLVDEYCLLVHPVALGRGLPLISDLPNRLPLSLVSSTAFRSGAVAQVYRPR